MALELLCKLQNDWRSVEDAQVCLEIFGEKWGFRAGGQVGGPTLGRILHRILLKAKVRLLEGSILKRGTPLWENVVFMCHLCSDVVLLRVGASTASSSLRLRQSLRDILLDVWELLLPQLAGVGDAGIGTMTKSGAVCAFPSCDQRTQIGSPYCVAHGASIGRNGNSRRVRVAEDEAARALHPGGCVWRMLQLQLQLLDDSVETGLLYQTNINRSRRRPDTAQWRRRRAAAETQLARLSIRTCEQVRRLHGWMGRAGMLQNAQAEDRQSNEKSDGTGQKAAAHPEGHYRHTRMEMALLIYSITQCFKLLGRVCTLGWKKAQKQMRPLLRLLVMETGPHLSSRAQNRRVVNTLRQAAHVGTSPEHWELWLDDPQCTFKSATDRIDGINNVYWTSLAQHLERRQNFLKEAMDVADKEAKNARVLMVTGSEKRLYDSYKAERQRILDTQRTKKADFLEGWRRLRRLMRTFALTPGPWTMVLGSDDDSRDLAASGGEGSIVARRHQQQMYWKLSSAQNCVGMRIIMRYNWRATNHGHMLIHRSPAR